jgi:hypothetical protein
MKIALLGTGISMLAAPAFAGRSANRDIVAPQDDGNPYWLDYKTDVSEAKRELASDLRGADDERDRERAWTEYHREIADAKADYRKEMLEKGYRMGTVTVEEAE